VGWLNCKNKSALSPSYTCMSDRILRAMSRARTQTREFGSQPLSQLLLAAALCAFVMIVKNVAAMFGMRRRSSGGDWHTEADANALPQTKPDIQFKDTNCTNGVILGLVPGTSVGTPRGLATDPLETSNRDSRHKAENDSTVAQTSSLMRSVGGGGSPRLRGETEWALSTRGHRIQRKKQSLRGHSPLRPLRVHLPALRAREDFVHLKSA
jgi:hypothetical protein